MINMNNLSRKSNIKFDFNKNISGTTSMRLKMRSILMIIVFFNLFFLIGCNDILHTKAPGDKNSEEILLGGLPLYSSNLESRSISAENKTGAKGQGGKDWNGRKGSPCYLHLKPGESYIFCQIEGPGVIRHIWMTIVDEGALKMRNVILRFYWDDQTTPSVEAPISDFFGNSHGRLSPFDSEFLTVAEKQGGFNCYFPMPFKKKAKLLVQNENDTEIVMFFYEVDYTSGDVVTDKTPYFHAQFRRVLNTTMYEDYIILDGVEGKGRYMGANIGIVDRFHDKNVWWGEGEVKMYIDGDTDYPTICGTGTEDYAGSAWGIGQFSARYFGAPLIKDQYNSFYRFHVLDPVYFSENIKVTIQQIGNDGSPDSADPNGILGEFIAKGWYKKDHLGVGNFERVDDYCSTAYWYQTLPTKPFPAFPNKYIRSKDI
jgi:hypothetical protein